MYDSVDISTAAIYSKEKHEYTQAVMSKTVSKTEYSTTFKAREPRIEQQFWVETIGIIEISRAGEWRLLKKGKFVRAGRCRNPMGMNTADDPRAVVFTSHPLGSSFMATTSRSLINTLPHGILGEIFKEFIPQNSLQSPQPDVTIAPMVLCHVCSFWRSLVLTNPSLWLYLYLLFYTWKTGQGDSYLVEIKGKFKFTSWWAKNQGTIAPFLRFDADAKVYLPPERYKLDLSRKKTPLFYALLGPYATDCMLQLRTLVKSDERAWTTFSEAQCRTPSYIPYRRRRLSVQNAVMLRNFNVPKHWSNLTRIILAGISINLDVWYSLLSTLRTLALHSYVTLVDGQRAINELLMVLQSAPGITTLFLEDSCDSFFVNRHVSTMELRPSSIVPHPQFFANPRVARPQYAGRR
ncbi:hypothetical protein BDN70DRAFT_897534 [Pholiota conissans]|uniref:F-box domain-containing protein n=1 Tax=Pholiota conissans TaxID=109636 RepID=A0A9P5YWY8_9AGAR|nr:hypothetical protein BDN70DRAFT_897534 [Pholiota conissans]